MMSSMHGRCLFSVLPQLYSIAMTKSVCLTVSAFRSSRFMRSVVSFELDEDCILPKLIEDEVLFFPHSFRLTHIRTTLLYLDDCIDLLNQLGSQLHSFAVSLAYPAPRRNSNAISRIASVNICFLFDI